MRQSRAYVTEHRVACEENIIWKLAYISLPHTQEALTQEGEGSIADTLLRHFTEYKWLGLLKDTIQEWLL